MKKLLIIGIFCLLGEFAHGQITQIEYFIDTEPGFGKGVTVPLTTDADGYVNFNIPLQSVEEGFHSLFVRTKRNDGKWSHTDRRVFFVRKGNVPPRITKILYSFSGEGAPETTYEHEVNEPQPQIDINFLANLAELPHSKTYKIYLQALDENGYMSKKDSAEFFVRAPIIIEEIIVSDISCFGFNDGKLEILATFEDGELEYSIDNESFQDSNIFENLVEGQITIFVRSKEDPNNSVEEEISITEPLALTVNVENIIQPECPENQTGGFSINVSGGTAPYTFKLSSEENYTDQNVFSDLLSGNFTINVKDANGCLADVNFEIESIAQSPQIPIITIEGTDGISTEVNLKSSSPTNNQWYRNGTEIPGATGQSLEITQPGSYQVKVTGEAGCSSISEVTVITSSPEAKSLSLKLYPNPAENAAKIDFGRETMVEKVVIYSSTGIILREINEKMMVDEIQLDLSGLPAGSYFIQVEGIGLLERIKFIKR